MTTEERQNHEIFMRRCLELARTAQSRGDSPVGSVLVRHGKIVAEGIEANKTKNDVTCHAEIEVIRNAAHEHGIQDLTDCTLYTTHEPCIMCSYVIRHAKIPKVVAGLTTGEIGGFSSELPVLATRSVSKWAPPPVFIHGILEHECRELHK